jgi:HEAT repeat protein
MRILPPGLALLLLAGAGQEEPPAERVRALGAAAPAAREAAAGELRRLGETARPALEAGARDADAEVALRSRLLLRRLDLVRDLPGLDTLLPGAWDRLARGGAADWTRVFLEISEVEDASRRRRRILGALAPRAVRGAATPEEKKKVCEILARDALTSALPEAIALLRDPDGEVRERATWTLHERGHEHERALVALLADPSSDVRCGGLRALAAVFQLDALPLLRPLLDDPAADVRQELAEALSGLQERGSLGADLKTLVPLLRDPDDGVRWAAVQIFERERCAEAIPDLIGALKDVDDLVRRDAAYALGRAEAAEAREALERLLGDPTETVRAAGAWALGRLRRPESILPLLRVAGAQEKDVETRESAIEALAALEAREALADARTWLDSADEEIRRAAVSLIWAVEGAAGAESLAPLLRDASETLRDDVEELFAGAPDPRVGAAVLPLLDDKDGDARLRAVRLLQRMPFEEAMPALARRLTDDVEGIAPEVLEVPWIRTPALEAELRGLLKQENADVRRNAASALVDVLGSRAAEEAAPHLKAAKPSDHSLRQLEKLQRVEDIPYLLSLLGDKNADAGASRALSAYAPRDVAPGLLKRLESPSEEVRHGAVALLSQMALPETERALTSQLASGSPRIRHAALQGLSRIGARSRVPVILALLDSPEDRLPALEVLGALGAVEALPRLRPLLKPTDPELRDATLFAMARMGAREAVPGLLDQLDADDDERRQTAVDALGLLRAREAAERIEGLLPDERRSGRLRAVWALARIGRPESARAILPHLQDWGSFAAAEAGEALGLLGTPALVPELRARLRHRSGLVRRGAAVALGELGAREAVPDLLPLLRDRMEWCVVAAAETLSRLQATEAIPDLRAALRARAWRSEEAAMEWHVVEALVRLRARDAAPDLLDRLGSEDFDVRRRIVGMVRRLGDPATHAELRRRLVSEGPTLLSLEPDVLREDLDRFPAPLLLRDLPSESWMLSVPILPLLADLGAREIIPDLRRLLGAATGRVRRSAADALCRLGDPEGVPILLAEAERGRRGVLLALNALRRPALWARLRETPIPAFGDPSQKGLWEGVALGLGLRPDLSDRGWPGGYADPLGRGWIRAYEGAYSLLDVAAWLLDDTRLAAILEDDRLRVVPEDEALAFWKAWWADRK